MRSTLILLKETHKNHLKRRTIQMQQHESELFEWSERKDSMSIV